MMQLEQDILLQKIVKNPKLVIKWLKIMIFSILTLNFNL